MMLTVCTGTRMSPSAGWIAAVDHRFTRRWFIAIMMPLAGHHVDAGRQPAMSAIWPAHGPPRVEHEAGVDDAPLRRDFRSVRCTADDPVAVAVDPGDPVVGQHLGAVGLAREFGVAPHQLPAVDGAVLHLDGARDARVEPRLACAGPRPPGSRCAGTPVAAAAGEEAVGEGRVVAGVVTK